MLFKRISIRYKIGFIAIIGLIGFVVFQTANYRLSNNLKSHVQDLRTEDFSVLKFMNDIQVQFSELDKLYQAALAEDDFDTLGEANAKAANIKLNFELIIDTFDIKDLDFLMLKKSFEQYVEKTSQHTSRVMRGETNYEDTLEGYKEVALLRERYFANQVSLLDKNYVSFGDRLTFIVNEQEYLVQFGLILGMVLSILLVVFSAAIVQRLIRAFDNAVNVAEQIASGNLDQRIKIQSDDETGQLLTALQQMREALKQRYEEDRARDNLQQFLAGLNETMRGDKSLHGLSEAIVHYLVLELHGQLGAFYHAEDKKLKMIASYALDKDSEIKSEYELGESIIGQVGAEQSPKIIDNVPEKYVIMATGLGKAKPRSLLLFPVVFEGELKAVIELAAFRSFSEDDIKILQRCNNAMAFAINSAEARFKVATMLKQTQEQAATLEKQGQELALFNIQLEEKNKDLDNQKSEVIRKNKELELSEKALFEKTEALELSGKYKSQFLSTMSHELRTPLNSILILSEALINNAKGNLDDEDCQHAKVIHNAGADLLALINDILDLSKIEEGKMEIVIDQIDIKDFADGLRQQFEFVAGNKGLEFAVEIENSLPEYLYTDRHRLRQILKNFISNALKFTENGGVYINIGKKETPETDEALLRIEVRDTGVGIDKSKQSLVFEAFKQADGTTSRKFGGTGLGLAISRELSGLLGGEISLYSEGEAKGSIFSLVIPIGSAAMLDPDSPVDKENKKPFHRVVSIDENSPNVAGIEYDILLISTQQNFIDKVSVLAKKSDMTINIAKDLDEAIKLEESIHYDTVFVEYPIIDHEWNKLAEIAQGASFLFVSANDSQKSYVENIGYNTLPEIMSDKEILEWIEELTRHNDYNKVLVVEDNPVFHEVIKSVFSNNYIEACVVETGEEAIKALNGEMYRAMVVDLNLPDYNGIDLLKVIRKDKRHYQTPIIVFTAEDLDRERRKDILAFANDVYTKSPKAVIEICKKIKSLIEHEDSYGVVEFPYYRPGVTIDYEKGMLDGKQVLVVDDDERNLYSLSAILSAENLKVTTMDSGRQALEFLKNKKDLDIVLLDIMMPEMDGYEVLKQIRADLTIEHLPVIALTAKAMIGDREKCLASGATDYLAKPVNTQQLLNTLATHIIQDEKYTNH